MATVNANPSAMIRINTVRVRKFEVIVNPHALHLNIFATAKMQSPIGRVAKCQISYGYAPDIFKTGQCRPPSLRRRENVLGLTQSESPALTVDGSKARHRDVRGIFRTNPQALVGFFSKRKYFPGESLYRGGTEQNCPLRNVEVDMRLQLKSSGEDALSTRNEDASTTRRVHEINGPLDRGRIIAHSVGNRAMIDD
jgi:hypothetical protein